MSFLEAFIHTRDLESGLDVQNQHIAVFVLRMSSHEGVPKLLCDLVLLIYERASPSAFPTIRQYTTTPTEKRVR